MQKKYSVKFIILHDKSSDKTRIEGRFLNIIKAIHDKPIANIILNDENLKPFPLKSGMRQGCPIVQLTFNIVLKFLSRATGQEEEIKGLQIGKEVKLSLSTDDMILYLKNLKNFTKNLRDSTNSSSKAAGYKTIYKQQFAPTMNRLRKNMGKQFHLQ
jgi:hypothetical protein